MSKRFKVSRQMDGLPELQGATPLSFFDPSNPDVNLFNLVDDEVIRITGSPLNYYKSFVEEDYDDVYLEARNRTVASEPIKVHGFYEPSVVEETLSQFGIEITNDQMFVFNKSYIEKMLSREPKIGDQIKPYFQNIKYEVIEVQEDSFEMYGVYHSVLTAKILRDDEETVNEIITETAPDVGSDGGTYTDL